jgi:hypothetical protein
MRVEVPLGVNPPSTYILRFRRTAEFSVRVVGLTGSCFQIPFAIACVGLIMKEPKVPIVSIATKRFMVLV